MFPVLTPSTPNMPSSTPTITLSNFHSLQSTPALALARPPSLLMAINKGSSNREPSGVDDIMHINIRPPDLSMEDGDGQGELIRPVIRVRPALRPRSFLHILEDFQEENSQVAPSPSTSYNSTQTDGSADVVIPSLHPSSGSSAASVTSFPSTVMPLSTSSASRIEDTARRQQRFSLPIVGLQTTSVTARANTKGEGIAKRFSLVLGGGRTIKGPKSTRVHATDPDQEVGEGTVKQSRSTGHGVAASTLADLLDRRKGT